MSHFGAITQNVKADENNSSVVNLSASETFTGTASSTLGVVGVTMEPTHRSKLYSYN